MSPSGADALLQRLSEDCEQRCAALRAASDEQARQIVRAARATAHQSVRSAVAMERDRMEFGLRQAAARADIEVRRQEQQASRELLGHLWAVIPAALAQRWADPALRRTWVAAALSQAGRLLAGRAWQIESAADWTPSERDELWVQARGQEASGVVWVLDAAMPPGLRIRVDRVCVDATVPGLLAQRERVESAFLAEYQPVIADG